MWSSQNYYIHSEWSLSGSIQKIVTIVQTYKISTNTTMQVSAAGKMVDKCDIKYLVVCSCYYTELQAARKTCIWKSGFDEPYGYSIMVKYCQGNTYTTISPNTFSQAYLS